MILINSILTHLTWIARLFRASSLPMRILITAADSRYFFLNVLRKNLYDCPNARSYRAIVLTLQKLQKKTIVEFLFDKELVEQTIKQFSIVSYRTPFRVRDFTITMRDAGLYIRIRKS